MQLQLSKNKSLAFAETHECACLCAESTNQLFDISHGFYKEAPCSVCFGLFSHRKSASVMISLSHNGAYLIAVETNASLISGYNLHSIAI